MRKRIVHVVEFVFGNDSTESAIELSKALPEFEHQIAYLNYKSASSYLAEIRANGIRVFGIDNWSPETLEAVGSDSAIFMHDMKTKHIPKEQWNMKWLKDNLVLHFIHSRDRVPLWPHTNLTVFESMRLRASYEEYKAAMGDWAVVYPGIPQDLYLKIPFLNTEEPYIYWNERPGESETVRYAHSFDMYGTAIVILGKSGTTRMALKAMLAYKPVIIDVREEGTEFRYSFLSESGVPFVKDQSGLFRLLDRWTQHPDEREEQADRLRNWAQRNATTQTLRKELFEYVASRVL